MAINTKYHVSGINVRVMIGRNLNALAPNGLGTGILKADQCGIGTTA